MRVCRKIINDLQFVLFKERDESDYIIGYERKYKRCQEAKRKW